MEITVLSTIDKGGIPTEFTAGLPSGLRVKLLFDIGGIPTEFTACLPTGLCMANSCNASDRNQGNRPLLYRQRGNSPVLYLLKHY